MGQYAMVAMAAVQVIGAISGGAQKSAQYSAAAQANEYNAAVLRQRSEVALSVSSQRESQQRRTAALAAGKMRAGIAQSGVGMGGTSADLERQSSVLAELDALNIRYEGETESRGLLASAGLEDMYAAASRSHAKSAKRSGFLSATGAALGGYGGYLSASNTPTTNPGGGRG